MGDHDSLGLERATKLHGSAVALSVEDRHITYGELSARASEVAGRLREQGIGKGSVVVLASPNSVEWITFLLGAFDTGAVIAVVDPELPENQRETVIAGLHARAVQTHEGLRLQGAQRGGPGAELAHEQIRLVMFTSGSTGSPKGVLVREGNLLANMESNAALFGLGPGHVGCLFLPLSAYMNLTYGLACLAYGAQLLLERGLFDLVGTLRRMDEGNVTALQTVPTALQLLVERGNLREWPLSRLQTVRVGAGVLTREIAARVFQQWPECELIATYGMTEVGLVGSQRWRAGEIEPGIFGDIVPDLEVGLDESSESGGSEIVLSSPNLFAGYFDPRDERLEKRSGGYRTGDLGEWTELGALRLGTRKKAAAKVAGVLVNLDRIGELVRSRSDVVECCVMAREHEWLGEEVHVVAESVPGQSVDVEALVAQIVQELSMPSPPRVHVVHSLPRSPMGKVARREVEKLIDSK